VLVSFHPAIALTRAIGLPDDKAVALAKAETLIASAIMP